MCARSTAAACRSASSADTSAMSVPAFHSTPRSLSSSMMAGSASFTNIPPTTGNDSGNSPAPIHRLQEREFVPLSRLIVVRAERGRHVHDAGAVIRAHEILADDDLVIRPLRIRQPVERPLVLELRQLRPRPRAHDIPAIRVVLAQHRAHARLGEDDRRLTASAPLELDVRQGRDAPRARRSTRASTAWSSTRGCARPWACHRAS